MTVTEDRIIDIKPLETPARDRALTRVDAPEEAAPARNGVWMAVLGAGLGVLWIAGCIAYLVGYSGLAALTASTPAQIAGLVFVALGPALFVTLAGFAARQMARFSAQARVLAGAASRLTRPEREMEGEARNLSAVLMAEVARVNTGMDAALARLGAMEEVIRHHADSLSVSASRAGEQSRSLIDDLRAEREALSALADILDAKAKMIADAIGEQSRMVARAAELAEGAANEGRTKIEAGAASLKTAAAAVADASHQAAGAMEGQRSRLSALADSFAEQSAALTRLYDTHREEMSEASQTLRDEQKRIASALDFHRAELSELVKVAGRGAEEMTQATRAGGESLRGAIEGALSQANTLGEIILARTEALSDRQHQRLAALDEAADRARAASEAAATALAAQAETIHNHVEQLGENTYDVATRAEKVFERRLDEAARAIDRVGRMADEADAALTGRFERSLESWREQLTEVEQRIQEVGGNLGAFPESARARVAELETAVRDGVEGLRGAARAAADEAREIDTALQTRMRHNYEMLGDFVMRMGSLGGRSMEIPAPLFGAARAARPIPASDTASEQTPEAPQAEPPTFESGLSWRDIVSGLRDSEGLARPPAPQPRPAAPMPTPAPAPVQRQDTAESLGADPTALTAPAARDAAHARRSAGIDAMRETVREHATDHVALLARTIERDPSLRARARRLVEATDQSVSAAAREDRPDRLIDLLSTPSGRGYLLLSAALGDA